MAANAGAFIELPLVDFGQPDALLGIGLDEGLSVAGLAVLRNHSLRSELMDGMFAVCRQFFDGPEETKRAVSWPGDGRWRGWFAVAEMVDCADVELVERLEYGRADLYADDGPPPWPSEPPGLRRVWTEYYLEVEGILARLLRCASLRGRIGTDIVDAWASRHESNLSANCYLNYDVPGDLPGMKPHTDFGGLTVLAADGSWPRFEAFVNGAWHPIAFGRHDLVLQVGDLLSAAADGRWPATMHRVSYERGSEAAGGLQPRRISLAYFHIPDPAAVLPANSVLPNATTVGDYIRSRMLSY